MQLDVVASLLNTKADVSRKAHVTLDDSSDASSSGEGATPDALDAPSQQHSARAGAQLGTPVAASQKDVQTSPMERTVFVRGMPLDTTQQQLRASMQQFGAITACRFVRRSPFSINAHQLSAE